MDNENKKSLRQEYFDTYEAMSKNEREELILIQKIKSNVKYFIGIDNIIQKIIELIDNAETVSFASDRNRKYISKKQPLFVLKINKKNIPEKLVYANNTNADNDYFIENHLNPKYENDVKTIQNHIQEEVVEPYSKWLMDYLMDNDKFMKLCKENGLNELTLDENTLRLILRISAVMFAIKVDLKNNKVFLEYAV